MSAYSPLAVILMIQDMDIKTWKLGHPYVVFSLIGVAVLSCFILWAAVSFVKTSSPTVLVKKVSNRSGELVNYSIPYLVSFFVMDLGNMN
ncbi:MAG: hypothetical protein OJI67_01790, partial [Prosthecobacter sp.]|nr:hypothetical protein [Prosthecobacter sp.]